MNGYWKGREGRVVEDGKSGSQRRVWWAFDVRSWLFFRCTTVDPGCPFPCIEAPPSLCSDTSHSFPLAKWPESLGRGWMEW